jgi:hypothetical protein
LSVDDGGLLARDGPGEGLLVLLTRVQVVVAGVPLGTGCAIISIWFTFSFPN